MTRLTGQQLADAFGDPRPYMLANGTVAGSWERRIIGYAELPSPLPLSWDKTQSVKHFKCHRLLVPAFTAAMVDVYADQEVWATVNDFGGCYEFRVKRRPGVALAQLVGLDRLSTHAWGAGIDLDAIDNPQHAAPKAHPRLPVIMAAHGFLWGGTFAGDALDPMHWEFADLGRLR
jgi:hypothetical protein